MPWHNTNVVHAAGWRATAGTEEYTGASCIAEARVQPSGVAAVNAASPREKTWVRPNRRPGGSGDRRIGAARRVVAWC